MRFKDNFEGSGVINQKASKAGVLNLLVPTYPQIKIVLLCVPPNQNCMPFAYPKSKILPKWASFEHFFKFCVPPVTFSRTPRGSVPQVENSCSKGLI